MQETSITNPYNPDFAPSYTRRKKNHNYYGSGTYHIILKKQEGAPVFSRIVGDSNIEPGKPGCAKEEWSLPGRIIASCIYGFNRRFPIIEMYSYCVMPDHVHILLHKKGIDEHHLGYFIGQLKSLVCRELSKKIGREIYTEQIFQQNYTDKILYPWRSLDETRTYIKLNPHRLATRQQNREFFKRMDRLRIGEREYEAYGNVFLFQNPDKEVVKVSRKFTETEKKAWRDYLIEAAETQSVMVSPFVAPEEKALRKEIEAIGAPMIVITYGAFPERFRPSGNDHELCRQGKLLIISLGLPEKTAFSRQVCVQMNALAAEVAALGKSSR